ncbi:MAG: DUF58 domain-containing protein [Luminiphilus sp.]|nr:DUF58 domain-containing protein [Luminiphilus sp.]
MGGGAYVQLRDLVRLRYQARGFSYLPAQPVNSVLAGRKRSRLRGRGLDFDELRHYRPGDDIRTMDWRVTRRTRTPFVRVYTEERDRPVWVVVDQRLAMFFGSRYQMKSVAAAQAAALTAWRVIGVGDRIGALLFNDQQSSLHPPSRSPGALLGWLEQLATMNNALAADAVAPARPDALGEALHTVSRYLTHDSLVIVISDFDGWSDDCLTAIKAMRQSNDVITGLVSDPLEHSLASADKLVVSDGAYQLQVEAEKADAEARFSAGYSAQLTSLGGTFKRHGIPLIPLTTESDVAGQLLRQLGGATARTAPGR